MSRLCLVLAVVAAVTATACTRPAPKTASAGDASVTCAALPATYRTSLRLAPDGKSLFWVERISRYGYTSGFPTTRLVEWRFDGDVVAYGDDLTPPFRVLDDRRVVARSEDGVHVWDRGELALISSYGPDVGHFELLGDQSGVVYIAGGWLVHQPLAREAGRRLTAAEDLIGVAGSVVYARRGDHVVAIDTATGATTSLPPVGGRAIEVHGGGVIVDRGTSIVAIPVTGGDAVTVAEGEDWDVRYTPDGVLLQRTVDGRREGGVVSGTAMTPFAAVTGVDGIAGFVRLPDGRGAYLMGHDTNQDGELGYADEADVCIVGAGAKAVAVEPRKVPARHAGIARELDEIVEAHVPGATWRLEGADGLPRVLVTSAKRLGDHAARRATVTALTTAMIAVIGDDAYDVEIKDDTGRRVTSEWQAWSRRRMTFSGAGNMLAASLDEAGLVVEITKRERDAAGKLVCEGTVTARDATYRDVSLDCAEGARRIAVGARLEPGVAVPFSATLDAAPDADLHLIGHHGDDDSVAFALDAARVRQDTSRVAIAEQVLDRTDLALTSYGAEGELMVFDLRAAAGFSEYSHVSRARAAGTAHDLFAAAAVSAFGATPDQEVWLRITDGDRVWNSNGGPPFEVTEYE
jgi:hypothetical protein